MAKKKKKHSSKKKSREHPKVVLQEALHDISKELSLLNKEKLGLSRKIDGIDAKILATQNRERLLRDRITRLVAMESDLSGKKSSSESQMHKVQDKLSKVKKIKEELGEV